MAAQRALYLVSLALLLLAVSVAAQSSITLSAVSVPSTGNAPLTTNNANTKDCIQYGDCTTAPPGATTLSFAAGVPSAPASMTIPIPTDPAEIPAYQASLASAGAASAYSSRLANGGNTIDAGLTQAPGSSPSAGRAPSNVATANVSQNSGNGAARSAVGVVSWQMWALSPAIAIIGAAAGAAFVL